MEMTIDDALSHLYTYSSTMGSGQTTQKQHEDAKKVAIDTMRKYQKMLEAFDKIREQIKSNLRGVEIALEVLNENHPLRPKMEGAKDTLEECLELIDKAETEAE